MIICFPASVCKGLESAAIYDLSSVFTIPIPEISPKVSWDSTLVNPYKLSLFWHLKEETPAWGTAKFSYASASCEK